MDRRAKGTGRAITPWRPYSTVERKPTSTSIPLQTNAEHTSPGYRPHDGRRNRSQQRKSRRAVVRVPGARGRGRESAAEPQVKPGQSDAHREDQFRELRLGPRDGEGISWDFVGSFWVVSLHTLCQTIEMYYNRLHWRAFCVCD